MAKNNNVFLIDDDRTTNFVHRTLISKFHPELAITDFMEAYDFLEFLAENINRSENLPNYILLDINMPQMNGWEFLEEYKKTIFPFMRKCKVVMVTSSDNGIDLEKSKDYGFVKGYYVKPLSSEMLAEIFE
ncbi:MAG: response regulator [Cytophagales bacterium]